jgi:hypothetical protein
MLLLCSSKWLMRPASVLRVCQCLVMCALPMDRLFLGDFLLLCGPFGGLNRLFNSLGFCHTPVILFVDCTRNCVHTLPRPRIGGLCVSLLPPAAVDLSMRVRVCLGFLFLCKLVCRLCVCGRHSLCVRACLCISLYLYPRLVMPQFSCLTVYASVHVCVCMYVGGCTSTCWTFCGSTCCTPLYL